MTNDILINQKPKYKINIFKKQIYYQTLLLFIKVSDFFNYVVLLF